MIKYNIEQKRWIDTEDPTWVLETEKNGIRFQDFPDEFVVGKEPTETFETPKDFFHWLSGHHIKYSTICLITAPTKASDKKEIPFYWQLNLHPLVTTEEFSWGVRIADKFEYWYHAHQFAQRVDAYINDVLDSAKENWEEQFGEFLQQGESKTVSLGTHPNFHSVEMLVEGLGILKIRIEKVPPDFDKWFVVSTTQPYEFLMDEKGNTRFVYTYHKNNIPFFETLDSAIAFIQKIDQCWKADLPEEDIDIFLSFMRQDGSDDLASYEKFVTLLKDGKWEQAKKHFKNMDTFVRDAIPLRIIHEIEKQTAKKNKKRKS